MLNLNEEKKIFDVGHKLVAGIDEAGRGPLAGPVVAACVVLDKDFEIDKDIFEYIKDSKKLTPKKREEIFEVIQNNFSNIGVGVCDNSTIDRLNILGATFLAMKKALSELKEKPNYLLIDGHLGIPNCSYSQKCIKGGDKYVFSIAAASIIAKVTRDNFMKEIHEKYPDYGFDKHKGYGTKLHLEQIKKHGPCAIHRKSFAPCK